MLRDLIKNNKFIFASMGNIVVRNFSNDNILFSISCRNERWFFSGGVTTVVSVFVKNSSFNKISMKFFETDGFEE